MCTVTLVPLENKDFILVSNRDEAPTRGSLYPDFYKHKSRLLLYPKDLQSEGTWIGLSDNKRLICLLNGGFEIHQTNQKYRYSRGLVVKDLLVAVNLKNAIEEYDLNNIEPFTLVIVEWSNALKFLEFVWDGKQKHFKRLTLESKIWSSSTLYNSVMRAERKVWFEDFKRNREINPEQMFEFHRNTDKGNKDYGVVMDRGYVKTTSITSIVKAGKQIEMRYFDIESKTQNIKKFKESSVIHE